MNPDIGLRSIRRMPARLRSKAGAHAARTRWQRTCRRLPALLLPPAARGGKACRRCFGWRAISQGCAAVLATGKTSQGALVGLRCGVVRAGTTGSLPSL